MKPRIKIITLAVRDLEKSLAFYRDGMGLPTEGIIGTEFFWTDTFGRSLGIRRGWLKRERMNSERKNCVR